TKKETKKEKKKEKRKRKEREKKEKRKKKKKKKKERKKIILCQYHITVIFNELYQISIKKEITQFSLFFI
ncbi:MAG: hypothetical protein HRT63_13695, partial [Erythrobacter sp.]|nr:hypothetical protein [Erythrobacter sp.]